METSLASLLSTLQTSLDSAATPESLDILPPQNGISLLDLKNELFLSYLQNLVFLILIKLRHSTGKDAGKEEVTIKINDEVTKKLAELRLYLEKGVKPLEGKLKYQIEKVVKAAEDANRPSANGGQNGVSTQKKTSKKERKPSDDESDGSEDASGSESDEDSDEEDASSGIDELSYRPNPAALMRPKAQADEPKSKSKSASDEKYKPPRITATSMPVTRGKEEKAERKPNKSATLDEFIAAEMSTAPMAEPSVGSSIAAGGRRMKTQRERDTEAERSRYEEEHLMRLPKESKKERAKRTGRDRAGGGFGGEDWRGLDSGLDRIDSLVKRKSGGGVSSKKRRFEGGSGGGAGEMGGDFERRRAKVMKKFR